MLLFPLPSFFAAEESSQPMSILPAAKLLGICAKVARNLVEKFVGYSYCSLSRFHLNIQEHDSSFIPFWGHGGRVVTISLLTFEIGVHIPAKPRMGKLVVNFIFLPYIFYKLIKLP